MDLNNICDNSGFLRAFLIFKYALNVIFVVLPIIIIVMALMDFFKVVITGKTDDMISNLKMVGKRLVAAFIVFLVPTGVKFAFSLVGDDLKQYTYCMNTASVERIEYLKVIEPAKTAVDSMERTPTELSIKKAKAEIEKVAALGEEDTVIDWLTKVSQAEQKLEADKKLAECRAKGGTYKNGYCSIIKLQTGSGTGTGSDTTGSSTSTEQGGGSAGETGDAPTISGTTNLSGDMVTINVNGESFKAINTPIGVADYASYLRSAGIYQGSNQEKYGDKCLGFSYTHASGLYQGKKGYKPDDGMNYVGAGSFQTYINDSEREFLTLVYQELTANRPVIIQVNGNKAGTSRHFVTAVGFRSSVENANSLKATDLIIIDSWDAKLERMDQSGSRFLTTGKDCHKDYTGYRAQYLK